jgi:hypothetical protein
MKCCVDGYNFNNLILYTQRDAIYKETIDLTINCGTTPDSTLNS